MGVTRRGVLGEILGVEHLPDVVIERPRTYELSIGVHLRGSCCSEDRDLVGVLECPWSDLREML